jgi:cyanophycin synthetase
MTKNIVQIGAKGLVIHGFLYGFRYPSLVVSVSILPDQITHSFLNEINLHLAKALYSKKKSSLVQEDCINRFLDIFLYWVHELQVTASWPVFELGRIVAVNTQKNGFMIAIPVIKNGHACTVKILNWFLDFLNKIISGHEAIATVLSQLPRLIENVKKLAPKASNTDKFLKVAYALNIPFSLISGEIYQYGYAKKSHWLDSSFTDQTSTIGASLARNKYRSTQLLREAGMPVAANKLVNNIESAISSADEFGYPVVIKPTNLDGGIGVAPGLATPDEVRSAYNSVKEITKDILIEKHVNGRDYRLVVFRGELIWAIERVPAGVIGDGVSTIGELVNFANADPSREKNRRLVLDEEALCLLAKTGLDANTILGVGEAAFLRRIANISSGGTPVPAFDKVHPDNKLLAIRAAALLRLDFAGIDLLISDISRSWREVGAAICEINAQPQLGSITSAHLYGGVLKALMSGNGRIPIVVIVGSDPKLRLSAMLDAKLSSAGYIVGRFDNTGVLIAGVSISSESLGFFDGCNMLTYDRNVEAIILSVNDVSILKCGLPFQRIDVLLIAGIHISSPDNDDNKKTNHELIKDIISAVLPMCDGEVMALSEAQVKIQSPLKNSTVKRVLNELSFDQSVVEVIRALEDADKRLSISV